VQARQTTVLTAGVSELVGEKDAPGEDAPPPPASGQNQGGGE